MSGLQKYSFIGLIVFMATALGACKKWLPEDLDYISPKAGFTQKVFNPVLGRTSVFSRVFNTDNSTTPLNFKIQNVRLRSTLEASNDLNKMVKVWVWTKAYTGDEKSIAEIEGKRKQEDHPIWEIRPSSGDLIMWNAADSNMVQQLPQLGYLFDVVVSNSGGTNTYKDLVLAPQRELPYTPNDDIDALTGLPKTKKLSGDTTKSIRVYNHPQVSNILGDSTELPIVGDSVRVLFNKIGDGNSITFKFLGKDSLPINPNKFNRTGPLDSLMHAFNVRTTNEYIRYDVAYPIPVVNYATRWTTGDGSQAKVSFAYDRKGFGGTVQKSSISFSFAIYQKGDWEVIFFFASDNPRFRDE